MMNKKIQLCIVTGSLKGVSDLIDAQSQSYDTHVVYIDYQPDLYDTSHYYASYPISYKSDTVLAELNFLKSFTIIPTLNDMYKQVRKIMKNNKIDIIHAHWAIPCGFISSLLANHVPLVITIRGLDAKLQLKQIVFQPFVSYALSRSSHVIAVSNKLRDEAIDLRIKKNKISVIPVGIDQKKFKHLDRKEIRNQLNLSAEEFIILFVGNLFKNKSVDRLLTICSHLKRDLKYRVIIIGSGQEEKNLKNLADSLGISEKVTFTGELSHEKIPSYMSASDVLFLLSKSEGLPGCIQEAMSCGIPVIASNVGGIPDIIRHEENGFLVSNDADALNYLNQIISYPEISFKIGRNAFQFAKDHLSLQKVVEQTDKIYRMLLNNRL
jgi:L-malate glycosyltransferase